MVCYGQHFVGIALYKKDMIIIIIIMLENAIVSHYRVSYPFVEQAPCILRLKSGARPHIMCHYPSD